MGEDPNGYYAVLGLEKSATADDIKRAYRKMAVRYHPDKPGGDEEAFKRVSAAYETLSDPERRAAYDGSGSARQHGRARSFGFGANEAMHAFASRDAHEIFRQFFSEHGVPGFSAPAFAAFGGFGGPSISVQFGAAPAVFESRTIHTEIVGNRRIVRHVVTSNMSRQERVTETNTDTGETRVHVRNQTVARPEASAAAADAAALN